MENKENKPVYQIVVTETDKVGKPIPVAESENQYELIVLLHKLSKDLQVSSPEAISKYREDDLTAGYLMQIECYDANFNALCSRFVLRAKPA